MDYSPYIVTIYGLLDPSRKIKAIKRIREITRAFFGDSYGLREAKGVVDSIERGVHVTITCADEREVRLVKLLLDTDFHTEPLSEPDKLDISRFEHDPNPDLNW